MSPISRKEQPTAWPDSPGRSTADAAADAADLKAHQDALVAARNVAVETFTQAAAAIAEALRAYDDVWKHAVRASMRLSQDAPNRASIGHPSLEPITSGHNPRHLKEALGRVLAAAGVDVTDIDVRFGQRHG